MYENIIFTPETFQNNSPKIPKIYNPKVKKFIIFDMANKFLIKVTKVETTNLTSLPLCLAVLGIRTREIAVQVRDRNLHTTNQQNDSEPQRWSLDVKRAHEQMRNNKTLKFYKKIIEQTFS